MRSLQARGKDSWPPFCVFQTASGIASMDLWKTIAYYKAQIGD